ncbi:MAG: hypothetical protein EOO40_07060 [Deltaproteobacteria bacterium]|nr:MAG: hypothetical protein EOO40_07060 [Deltaproteobacteria bacterium]
MTTAVMMTAPVESTPFDDGAARREGWLIAGCGTDSAGQRRVELQRLDDPQDGEGTFPDDGDAWKHVAERARRGSVLHLQALALVDPIERALIEQHAGH